MTFGRLAAALLLISTALAAEEHWDIQYRYRVIDSTLTINDLVFASEKRGIACGYITDKREKDKPVVLITSDGGVKWVETPVKETGLAMHFLDDSTGWMVTEKGIWKTIEAGRTWTKLGKSPAGMLRVWFLNRDHGFAAGLQKRIFETIDGGETWVPLDILKEIEASALYTTFGEISFSGDAGIISGWNLPPRRGGPDWMEPENAKRKQVPHYSVFLETRDGGKKWIKSEASVFGQVTRISLAPQGVGLGLVSFRDVFEVPSEVMRIDMRTGKSNSVFAKKDRAITDVRTFSGSTRALLAGYEPSGPIYNSPIPGRLKILTSNDLQTWTEMTVDYRAVAHSAIIAGPDDKHVWVATDTGMILKLVQD
jgi:hypothetical protein